MKNTMKIASAIVTFLWTVLLIISIVGRLTYKAPPSEEPFGIMLSKGAYNLFICLTGAGVLNSLLLTATACLNFGKKKETNKLDRWTTGLSVTTNLLFYLCAVMLLTIKRDWVLFVIAAYGVCLLVSIILMLISWIRKKI